MCYFKITIKDFNQSEPEFSKIVKYNSSLGSADWIDEDPVKTVDVFGAQIGAPLPYTYFGVAHFGSKYTIANLTDHATVGGSPGVIDTFPNYQLEMIQKNLSQLFLTNATLAVATNLTNGDSFSVVQPGIPLIGITQFYSSVQSVIAGANAILSGSAIGGTGQYSYQWLEAKPSNIHSFSNATDCINPHSSTCTFHVAPSTPLGLYGFELKATDNVTRNTTTSRPSYVVVGSVYRT